MIEILAGYGNATISVMLPVMLSVVYYETGRKSIGNSWDG